jgi:predicted dehydrogenase/threonine dehydrogenase-like Zn-dependent dehydrogenase
MRALLANLRSGDVETCDVPAPELRAGGVLVQTAFSAISAGTERQTIDTGRKSLLGKALARPDLVRQTITYAKDNGFKAAFQKVQGRLDTHASIGYSCAGTIVAVGDGVTEFHPGDRVACAGVGYASHSETNFVPRNLAIKIPDGVSLESASMTAIGAIAVHGLHQGRVAFGETVAVVGSGLIGILTIQLARAAGCRVIALDTNPSRIRRALEFGASHALDASDPEAVSRLASNPGGVVDVAIVTASSVSSEPVELAARLVRDRGRMVILGTVPITVSRDLMYRKELSLVLSRSYGPGRYDQEYEELGKDYPISYVRWTEQRNMEAFLDLVASGAVNLGALTRTRCSIETAAGAYSQLEESGEYTVILEYGSGESQKSPDAPIVALRPRANHLRIGCIGGGLFARSVVFPHLRKITGTRLEAVATASGISALSAQKSFGFCSARQPGQVIRDPDIDAVFVLSRHDTHSGYVLDLLRNRKPVFVEKPLAINREELASICELYDAERSAGRSPFVMVGFNRRFSPASSRIREFFLGRREPMVIQIRVNAGHVPRSEWLQQPGNGGRIVGELCHFLDWSKWLVDSDIASVYAHAMPDGKRYSRDNVAAVVSFADGSMANILYVANGDRTAGKEHYEVFCGGAIARLDNYASLELIRAGKRRKLRCHHDKGHQRELELSVTAMREGGSAPICFDEVVNVTEATFAVLDSLNSGLPVSLKRHESAKFLATSVGADRT